MFGNLTMTAFLVGQRRSVMLASSSSSAVVGGRRRSSVEQARPEGCIAVRL
jgi:hypothetical protein